MLSPTDIYILCFVSCFLVLFIFQNVIPYAISTFKTLVLLPAKAIGYCFLVNRYVLIGPFTVASAFFQLLYIGGNVVSLVYGVDSVAQAASRAGTLSLVNMAPLYFAMHLSYLADVFGLSLATYRQLHRSCGLIAVGHVIFHGAVALTHHSRLPLAAEISAGDWYPLIGAAIMILMIPLSIPLFRRRWYEIFLRLHQTLAIGVVVFVVNHLISVTDYQWTPLYIFFGIFCSLEAFYVASVIYHNPRLGSSCSRLQTTYNNGVISATIHLSRPLGIDAGQYLNIWVPSLSLFSSHPFTVTSWTPFPQKEIELLIKPRGGFTQKLFRHISNREAQYINPRVFFSGPHGSSAPVWEFDYVLLFATGFGIAAMLPYLTKLVHGCEERKSRGKRIHLIWQVYKLEHREAVKDVINPLLEDDHRSSANMLYISIYNGKEMDKESSEHGHCTINPGTPDVASIIKAESASHSLATTAKVSGHSSTLDSFKGKTPYEHGRTLVLVSANGKMRDDIQRATKVYLSKGFELKELDYQPET